MQSSFKLQPDPEADGLPRAAQQQPQSKPRKNKTTTALIKPKRPKVAPLPAIVQVRGYEITIPNTRTCWRINVVHGCDHPVMDISEVRYPGCDRPLVVEVNRHIRPCTEKCKVEGIRHSVEGLCGQCRLLKHKEDEQAVKAREMDIGWSGSGWDDLSRI